MILLEGLLEAVTRLLEALGMTKLKLFLQK